MAVGSKIVKVPVCFLCLRNLVAGETPGPEPNDRNNGDFDLLRRFLCLSLGLPPAVVGDLLCSIGQVPTGAGHGETLLCGSCEKEVSATCKLYRDLARKLRGLEGILEKSNETVSEKLRVNLHQKVAKQLNGNSGGGGGDRVKRLRTLLASKLRKRGRKLAGGGDDEEESRTPKKSKPMSKPNLNQDNAEVSENGTFENGEDVNLFIEMDDDDDHHSDADSYDYKPIIIVETRTLANESAPLVVGSGQNSDVVVNDDDDDDIQKRPFQCLTCNDLFETIEAVQNHLDRCRRGSLKVEPPKTQPKPKKAQKKRLAKKSKVGKAVKRVKLDDGGEFQCGFCGKKFTYIYHLTIHERIHTGEKPFECPNCKMKFNQKANCTRHQWICRGKKAAKISGTRVKRGRNILEPKGGLELNEVDANVHD